MTELPTPYIVDQSRTDALLSLLQPSLTDTDIARIVAAVIAAMPGATTGDDHEMHRPMDQGEAAAWLGVNRSTLSQWTNQDDDPAPGFRIGGKVLYTKADLVAWVRAHPVQQSEAA